MENVFSLLFRLRDFSFLLVNKKNKRQMLYGGLLDGIIFPEYCFGLGCCCYSSSSIIIIIIIIIFCSFLKCRRQRIKIYKSFSFGCFPVALNDRIIKLMMLKTILKKLYFTVDYKNIYYNLYS